MQTDIDYRSLDHRWDGFIKYYQFTTETEDSTADLVCEKHVEEQLCLNYDQKITLAFWFGAVGSPTSMILTNEFGAITYDNIPKILEFFKTNKRRLAFASDAKYRKIHFEPFMNSVRESIKPYNGNLAEYIFANRNGYSPETMYDKISSTCRTDWEQWGRMGHWCFSEALAQFVDFPISPPTMEFGPGGESHTAGWILAQQKQWIENSQGDGLDKKGIEYLENAAEFFIGWARERAWDNKKNINYFTLETACCNYKRQHKGSRYAGCYIDELYDDLQTMFNDWPEKRWLYHHYMTAREKKLPWGLLYEKSNDYDPLKPAYCKSWHKAFMEYGRMPRVEAWFNKNTQRWCNIEQLGYESSLEDFLL